MRHKKYPKLRDTRQHLYSFTSKPTGASHSHLHETQGKENRSRDFPFCASSLSATAPRVSLRRGARSSCLHVHVSLARVAPGSDPRLPVTRLLGDSVHNAEELPVQPDDSFLKPATFSVTLSTVPLRTLAGQPPGPPKKTPSQSFLLAV